MIINDYSQQDFLSKKEQESSLIAELITAGVIFVFPIVFLIIIST